MHLYRRHVRFSSDHKVAAEYRCKNSIFEGLLTSYSEGAKVKRQLVHSDSTIQGEGRQRKQQDARYALEIFEAGRGSDMKSEVDAKVNGGLE
jgi:hypothetical protein